MSKNMMYGAGSVQVLFFIILYFILRHRSRVITIVLVATDSSLVAYDNTLVSYLHLAVRLKVEVLDGQAVFPQCDAIVVVSSHEFKLDTVLSRARKKNTPIFSTFPSRDFKFVIETKVAPFMHLKNMQGLAKYEMAV